ncbi:MAG TPA: substrate-binding domain-containing protein [Dehalococcoidia bacterium]
MLNSGWGLGVALAVAVAVATAACSGSDDGDKASTVPAGSTANDAVGMPTVAIAPSPIVTKTSGELVLATTTSTRDSGLLDLLVPMFEKETGYTVTTVVASSAGAIERASPGDADVVLVHSPTAEQAMVDAGDGIERTLVMHSDNIIVGPEGDPAALKEEETLDDVMRAIAAKQARFISRGDNSDTHALEMKLWRSAGIEPQGEPWYEESGQGMAATLEAANEKMAYTISDRATYLAENESLGLAVEFEGTPALLNVYHVIVVNPAKHGNVDAPAARAFAAFLTRPDIQTAIGDFAVDEFGQPLFVPDAGKAEPAG